MQTQVKVPAGKLDPYVERFERVADELRERNPFWVFPLRKAAMARFAELGFPGTSHEDWRFTNVAPILKLPFEPVLQAGGKVSRLPLTPFSSMKAQRLVFVDGIFAPELSQTGNGIINIAGALAQNSEMLAKHLPHSAAGDQHAFSALNTAFFQDGAFIYIPRGQSAPLPVHLIFVQTGSQAGAVAHPRNLIITGEDSKLTVIESYISAGDTPYLTNAVTDFVVGSGSVVEHLKVQDEHSSAFHIGSLSVNLGANVKFLSHSIAVGSKLSRQNINTVLNGEGAECILNGLYLTKDEQLADHWMKVEHAKPFCASHEYFNGILEDKSRGVFHGRILVQPEAQKTDAKQTNKNLLLSDLATVNTKPQLEIYADDVKCTHGATVGQLNEESIFYLRARGMSLANARRMLIHAFAGEILDRIKCEPAREEMKQKIWERLERAPSLNKK
jgi:Fe-S cluster assembly protein SufD